MTPTVLQLLQGARSRDLSPADHAAKPAPPPAKPSRPQTRYTAAHA